MVAAIFALISALTLLVTVVVSLAVWWALVPSDLGRWIAKVQLGFGQEMRD